MNEMRAFSAPAPAASEASDGRTVAFVSLGDATDPHYSSGSPYGMRRGFIDIGCRVVDIHSVRPRREAIYLPLRAAYRAFGRYYVGDRTPLCLSAMAATIERQVEAIRPDLIFAAHSIPLTRVRAIAPLVFSHDQSFAERLHYAPYEARPIARRYISQGLAQERSAFANVDLAIYPSARSIRSLVEDYGVPREKCALVPWGGIPPGEPTEAEVEAMIRARPRDRINLLFIGVDWDRKGGDCVLEAAALLAARGQRVALTLIGSDVTAPLPDYVRYIPFLDKRRPDQLATLLAILREAHFLFVPSRAEAYGHVFCEAAAFGVPSVTRDVGGIPTIVDHARTGVCLPADATARQFADAVHRTYADPVGYRTMARAARADYVSRLNWRAFARGVLAHVDALPRSQV